MGACGSVLVKVCLYVCVGDDFWFNYPGVLEIVDKSFPKA